jgi:hypothetical protein
MADISLLHGLVAERQIVASLGVVAGGKRPQMKPGTEFWLTLAPLWVAAAITGFSIGQLYFRFVEPFLLKRWRYFAFLKTLEVECGGALRSGQQLQESDDQSLGAQLTL